ncbi:MAG: hypothetical protein IID48_08065 [Proteobacteria bacterium]|nr:hypothetical protein [Pseudomonadota bacterium]
MSDFTPKGYTSVGEAITRIGRSLSDEWTGEEFASAVATMANINRDTKDYFIGWVASHCIGIEDTSTTPKRRTKKSPDKRRPLSDSGRKRWNRASEIYEEARSLIDQMTQFKSIKDGGGHLAKIWNDRGIVVEWPEDFPLSKDDLEDLKVEEEEFRAPRKAAYKRLDKTARLLQQELCGTPPDCEDAIPALWRYPDKIPARIDPASWIGPAGLSRLKTAARDDDKTQGGSGIIVHLERIKLLCLSVKSPIGEINETEGADPPASNQQQKARKNPRGAGRKKGSGSFEKVDEPLLEKMKPLVAGGAADWDAALTVVGDAVGKGTDESRAKRLLARYKKQERKIQFN